MAHVASHSRKPEGPVIGTLTCRMVDGVLWLFDAEGRRLDQMREITVRQRHDDITVATVELIIEMERDNEP